MKIGLCTGLNRLEEAAALGFDYLELPLSDVTALEEDAFEALARRVESAETPVEACNVFYPGSVRLLDDNAEETVARYLERSLPRAARLGAKVCVFGSGGVRRRPESMEYDEAFRRLVRVTRQMGEAAAAFGLTIVIEPLNRCETNLINSVGEGACLRAAVNHPGVRLLADYFHVSLDGEKPEDVARVGGIAHCHVATAVSRRWPTVPEEGLRRMFTAMKATGYAGRVSVEGGSDCWAKDAPAALAVLRRMWQEA